MSTLASLSPQRREVIEQIAMSIREKKLRVLGFASTHFDAHTSQLVRQVAEVLGRAGIPTLVLDLTGGRGASSVQAAGATWMANDKTAPPANDSGLGFDVIGARTDEVSKAAFNDPQRIRQSLTEQYPQYSIVLLDLPGLIDRELDQLNGIAGAAACDGTLLVCPMGLVETVTIKRAVDLVRAAGGKFHGAIADDRENPSLRVDMTVPLTRAAQFVPFIGRRIASWILRRRILRSPIYT